MAIHRSAITLEPLIGEVNIIDELLIIIPVSGWEILGSK